MRIKNILTVLPAVIILAACTPAVTVPSPTATVVLAPILTPLPAASLTPTPAPETPTPISRPTGSLSAQGPWLVYLHNVPHPRTGDAPGVPEEFILMNQDGSGSTSITMPGCDLYHYLTAAGSSTNYMLDTDHGIYIFRPAQATGMLVSGSSWFDGCDTHYSSDDPSTGSGPGLLASIYQADNDTAPELIIYELPGGKIRDRFPLVKCPPQAKSCVENPSSWGQMAEQTQQWSPNDRYLAFVALMDADSSDLFIYDKQDGRLRRLTNGPDWVGRIEWSPDGTQIIMGEIARNPDGFSFIGPRNNQSSLWAVSLSDNHIKLLSKDGFFWDDWLRWLDDKRFLTFDGNLEHDQAENLRLVDIASGESRLLFSGSFLTNSFDPIHETMALYAFDSSDFPQGIYLVSVKNATTRHLDGHLYPLDLPNWDEETGLFLSDEECQDDPHGWRAFDYLGNFKCVPKSIPTATPTPAEAPAYPAPDGKWGVSLKDGTWLAAQGKAAVQISRETASKVLWCPDSSCFFFFAPQGQHKWALYRVSVPDLAVKMVDQGIESIWDVQWLGAGK